MHYVFMLCFCWKKYENVYKNTQTFAVSKSELLVNATEKQKRNNINYNNHHHHQDSCVKFTYFYCIGLDVL